MFNSKTDTVQLSDTLLKLDALYASYDQILTDVKTQLASLDVTDEQISRISRNLANNDTLRERVAVKTVKDLAVALSDASVEEIEGKKQLEGLIKAISDRVLSHLSDSLDAFIEYQLKQKLDEVYTDEKLQEILVNFFAERPAVVTAFKAHDCLDLMLQVLGYQKVEPESNN